MATDGGTRYAVRLGPEGAPAGPATAFSATGVMTCTLDDLEPAP